LQQRSLQRIRRSPPHPSGIPTASLPRFTVSVWLDPFFLASICIPSFPQLPYPPTSDLSTCLIAHLPSLFRYQFE
jgi:hypothetical protein